jgi:4-hydroxy-2-oxoheptanedioate aldolase
MNPDLTSSSLNLRERIVGGEFTIGTFIGLNSPAAAEVAAINGMDWVLLDLEHGSGGEDQIGPTVLATAKYGVPTIVRVESSERIRIGRALDAGALGVMIPRLEEVEDIKSAIAHLSYPPSGDRGVATYNRSTQWGKNVSGLTGPRRALGIVQIESAKAVANVESIAAISGLDVLFIGPLDLSFDLGVPRDFKHPTFIKAINSVLSAAKKAGKVTGILAMDAQSATDYKEQGFNFIAVGSDSSLLAKAIDTIVTSVKSK